MPLSLFVVVQAYRKTATAHRNFSFSGICSLCGNQAWANTYKCESEVNVERKKKEVIQESSSQELCHVYHCGETHHFQIARGLVQKATQSTFCHSYLSKKVSSRRKWKVKHHWFLLTDIRVPVNPCTCAHAFTHIQAASTTLWSALALPPLPWFHQIPEISWGLFHPGQPCQALRRSQQRD